MFKIIIASCIFAVACINLQAVEAASFIPNPLNILTNVQDQASTFLDTMNIRKKISQNLEKEAVKISERISESLNKQIHALSEENEALMADAQDANTSECCKLYDNGHIFWNKLVATFYKCLSNEMHKLTENTVEMNNITREVGEIMFNLIKPKLPNLMNPMSMANIGLDMFKTLRGKNVFSMLEKTIPIAMKIQLISPSLGVCMQAGYYKEIKNGLQDDILNGITSCVKSIIKQ